MYVGGGADCVCGGETEVWGIGSVVAGEGGEGWGNGLPICGGGCLSREEA